MLISALNQYYDIVAAKDPLSSTGYANCSFSYRIELTPDGRLSDICDCRTELPGSKGAKKPVLEQVASAIPERPRSSSIGANFVEIRPGYIFGLEYRSDKASPNGGFLTTESAGKTEKQKEKLKKQHQSFCKEVEKDFGGLSSPVAQAYAAFARSWKPEEQTSNPVLLKLKADLNKSRFAFCIAGHPDTLLQDEPDVKSAWQAMRESTDKSKEKQALCQCAVTGEKGPVAVIHDALVVGAGVGVKGVGINPSLVNFNCDSFLSYGHAQGENACISEEVMHRYTKALNFILSSPIHHSYLDGQTFAYWSMDGNEDNDCLMKLLLEQPFWQYPEGTLSKALQKLYLGALSGNVVSFVLDGQTYRITPEAEYYFAGMAPNSSRIQIKFLYTMRFQDILANFARFERDLQIQGTFQSVPLWKLKQELTDNRTSHPENDDALYDSVIKSVITGTPYPVWLLDRVVTRIRTDSFTDAVLDTVRLGCIRAYLIRNKKEEIGMDDNHTTSPAYLGGALFAVLQQIQETAAAPKKLTQTIKDVYFGRAMQAPGTIMPFLVRQSSGHIAALRRKKKFLADYYDAMLADLINKLSDDLPAHLCLEDQGRFALGYYQERKALFEKKEEKGEAAGAGSQEEDLNA